MKYYLLAGEASGDLHGSNLASALIKEDPAADLRAWGGDLMENAGAKVVKHYRELAFMGFVEVLKNLPTILKNFSFCKKDILGFQPDVLILIDYPGFNLRMAKWAKKNNLRTFYYISPQLWAWNSKRVNIIKKNVERMYVILPFEKAFYKKHGVEVDYPGHPLVGVINNHIPAADFYIKNNLAENKKIIALLPGSRRQEIKRMLGTMLEIRPFFPGYQFVIAGAPSIEMSFYKSLFNNKNPIPVIQNQTYDLLKNASAALVTSGTATLETALCMVPQVVCYSGNWLSYKLAKILVNKDLKFISLANLIADEQVVTELVQNDFSVKNLRTELTNILEKKGREKILRGYELIHEKLNKGGASERAAKMMVKKLKKL